MDLMPLGVFGRAEEGPAMIVAPAPVMPETTKPMPSRGSSMDEPPGLIEIVLMDCDGGVIRRFIQVEDNLSIQNVRDPLLRSHTRLTSAIAGRPLTRPWALSAAPARRDHRCHRRNGHCLGPMRLVYRPGLTPAIPGSG
jgi:hypothetical protein